MRAASCAECGWSKHRRDDPLDGHEWGRPCPHKIDRTAAAPRPQARQPDRCRRDHPYRYTATGRRWCPECENARVAAREERKAKARAARLVAQRLRLGDDLRRLERLTRAEPGPSGPHDAVACSQAYRRHL